MRGKDSAPLPFRSTSGITPAYAGKRSRDDGLLSEGQDHPRVCGEKSAKMSCCALALGSPPRMRGKAVLKGGDKDIYGITPAYAGKRAPNGETTKPARDHPRVCGEKPAGTKARDV